MNITVAGTTYENVRLASDTAVKNVAGGSIGNLLTSAGGRTIARAGWNYWLFHSDGSHGAHNPSFTVSAINGAQSALAALDN